MKFFEASAYNSILKDYKPDKNTDAFNDKYIEYKSESDKKPSTNNILKRLNHICVI